MCPKDVSISPKTVVQGRLHLGFGVECVPCPGHQCDHYPLHQHLDNLFFHLNDTGTKGCKLRRTLHSRHHPSLLALLSPSCPRPTSCLNVSRPMPNSPSRGSSCALLLLMLACLVVYGRQRYVCVVIVLVFPPPLLSPKPIPSQHTAWPFRLSAAGGWDCAALLSTPLLLLLP